MKTNCLFLGIAFLFFCSSACSLIGGEIEDAQIIFYEKLSQKAYQTQKGFTIQIDSVQQLFAGLPQNQKLYYSGKADTLLMLEGQTQQLIHLIDSISGYVKDEIIGKDSETAEYKKPLETVQNHTYFLGVFPNSNSGSGSGAAFQLRKALDQYVENLVRLYNYQAHITQTKELNIRSESFTREAELNEVPWERYMFNAPAIMNLAMLEKIKLDVFEKASKGIQIIAQQLH